MTEALASSQTLVTSDWQLVQWVGSAATPLWLFVASALLASVWGWSRCHCDQRSGSLPPSPGTALPIVGHLHLMKSGHSPLDTFDSMRKSLGDIFSFYAGSRLIVVLNGYDVIHEALVKNAAVFSHRADTFMSQQMGEGKGIVNTSGRHWREQRQVAERSLRTANVEKIGEEVAGLLAELDQACEQGGGVVTPGPLLLRAFANLVISVIYGHRFQLHDPKFCSLMEALSNCFDNFGNTEPLNFFPIVRFLPGDPYRYWFCLQNKDFLESSFVYPQLQDHEDKLGDTETDDVIHTYLREMTKKQLNGSPTSMDKGNLVKVAGDLLAGGTEPPSTTAHWFLLYMLHFPQVQDRCYQELVERVGKDRAPTLQDRSQLPFLEACIMEVQRHADVGPFAMAHGLARDTEFRGYRLPGDAVIIINIHSVMHDATAWGDPEVFRPERFLGLDGEVKRHDHFVPYSLGPRVCPGEHFSRLELFLFLASILHRYRLSHPGSTIPPLKGKMALLHSPLPFSVKLERRL